jgi:hypothetical protein
MRIELTERQARLHQFILKSFSEQGRSPSLAEVQQEFSLDDESTAERFIGELEATKAIHRNTGDPLVTHAYPFSNEVTPYQVTLAAGTEVYSMCAIDALGIPFMLNQGATIISQCKHCGQAVSVEINEGKLASHAPDSLLVGYMPLGSCSTPATEQCPHINFFCSQEHLEVWMKSHPVEELKSLALPDALERGRQIFGSMMDFEKDYVESESTKLASKLDLTNRDKS